VTQSESDEDTHTEAETVPLHDDVDNYLKKVKLFAAYNGRNEILNLVMDIQEQATRMRIETHAKQTNILDFFKKR